MRALFLCHQLSIMDAVLSYFPMQRGRFEYAEGNCEGGSFTGWFPGQNWHFALRAEGSFGNLFSFVSEGNTWLKEGRNNPDKRKGFKCWMFLSDQRVFIGLAGAKRKRLSPYEAKVECSTWFQVGRGKLCGAEGVTVKAWAGKPNERSEFDKESNREGNQDFSSFFRFTVNCCAHGALPQAVPALPSSLWWEPPLYYSGRKPLPSIVKTSLKPLLTLWNYNKSDVTDKSYLVGWYSPMINDGWCDL